MSAKEPEILTPKPLMAVCAILNGWHKARFGSAIHFAKPDNTPAGDVQIVHRALRRYGICPDGEGGLMIDQKFHSLLELNGLALHGIGAPEIIAGLSPRTTSWNR